MLAGAIDQLKAHPNWTLAITAAAVFAAAWSSSETFRVAPLETRASIDRRTIEDLGSDLRVARSAAQRSERESKLKGAVIAELGAANPLVAKFGPDLLYYQTMEVDIESGERIEPCLGGECFEFSLSPVYQKVYDNSPEPKPAVNFSIRFPKNPAPNCPQVAGVDGVPLSANSTAGIDRPDYDVRLQVKEVRFGEATIVFAIRRGTVESPPGEWIQHVVFSGSGG